MYEGSKYDAYEVVAITVCMKHEALSYSVCGLTLLVYEALMGHFNDLLLLFH